MKKLNKSLLCILLFTLTCLVLSSCDDEDAKDARIAAKIEECIEKGDFIKAKQLNKKMVYGDKTKIKICKAQVGSILDKGDFTLAADVAKEDADYGVYYVSLMGKLVLLYESYPKELMAALSSINIPSYNDNWDGETLGLNLYSGREYNNFYSSYNDNLKQLMLYAKAKDDVDYAKKLSFFLKPLYRGTEAGPNVKDYSGYEFTTRGYIKWENTPTDYSHANQIKNELGIN